jgi:antirestriction protein ArdC
MIVWNANCSSSSAREAPFANNDITRHASRLDRDLGRKPFADAGYAMEELAAGIGATFSVGPHPIDRVSSRFALTFRRRASCRQEQPARNPSNKL